MSADMFIFLNVILFLLIFVGVSVVVTKKRERCGDWNPHSTPEEVCRTSFCLSAGIIILGLIIFGLLGFDKYIF